jgi:hypothetical protein
MGRFEIGSFESPTARTIVEAGGIVSWIAECPLFLVKKLDWLIKTG